MATEKNVWLEEELYRTLNLLDAWVSSVRDHQTETSRRLTALSEKIGAIAAALTTIKEVVVSSEIVFGSPELGPDSAKPGETRLDSASVTFADPANAGMNEHAGQDSQDTPQDDPATATDEMAENCNTLSPEEEHEEEAKMAEEEAFLAEEENEEEHEMAEEGWFLSEEEYDEEAEMAEEGAALQEEEYEKEAEMAEEGAFLWEEEYEEEAISAEEGASLPEEEHKEEDEMADAGASLPEEEQEEEAEDGPALATSEMASNEYAAQDTHLLQGISVAIVQVERVPREITDSMLQSQSVLIEKLEKVATDLQDDVASLLRKLQIEFEEE